MNIALQEGRQRHQEQITNGQKSTAGKSNPLERARSHPTSLRAAINAKCFDCCGFSRQEVRLCVMTDCPLWRLRPWQIVTIDAIDGDVDG
jgi:hypothetical protein